MGALRPLRSAYHDGEGVLAHGLVVQRLGRVQDARAGVQAELLEAEGVGAAQQGEGQLVLLVLVGGNDPQDLGVGRRVLGHADVVALLGELGPVVVGVDDANQHLLGRRARTSRQGLQDAPAWIQTWDLSFHHAEIIVTKNNLGSKRTNIRTRTALITSK